MKEKMNYIEKVGILYPDIEMPEQKEICKWGLLHLGYLKRFRIARYNELLMSGELNEYLYRVNEEAQERFESPIVDLAESHGLTEELKAKEPMKWVQLANHVANAAKEIVESEVIYQMRSVLEELFYGNICPNTDCRSHDKETKQLMGYIANHHDNLFSTLNNQQKEIFEKFDDCYNELTDINEREIFAYAFKLGARIMLAVVSEKEE